MHFRSASSDTIMSFDDFCKQPLIQNNVDRDAILFHKMQMAARAHSGSTSSMDSSKSDPLYASVRDMYDFGPKASSHSIEVLIHAPPSQERRVAPPAPPPPPPPPLPSSSSSSQGAQGGRHQRSASESGEYAGRAQHEREMYAMETEVLEDFQVSIDEMYATVMKKKPEDDAGDEKGDDVKDDDDEEEEEEGDERRPRREADEDDDYMTVGEAHGVPDAALYRCLVDSQSLTSINDTQAEGDNSSVTESPAVSPVASPAGSPGQQRVSRSPSEASIIITYL